MTQVAEPGSARAAGEGQPASGGAVHHWINGRLVEGASGRRGPVFDPATGRLAREVDFASVEEVGAAVAAAKAAVPGWRSTSISKRTEILFRIRNLVETHRKELAARAFHEARACTPKRFDAVNCAAIPEGDAERLLFGALPRSVASRPDRTNLGRDRLCQRGSGPFPL